MNGSAPGIWFGQGTGSSQTFFGENTGDGSPYIIGFYRGGWKGPYFRTDNGRIGISELFPQQHLLTLNKQLVLMQIKVGGGMVVMV